MSEFKKQGKKHRPKQKPNKMAADSPRSLIAADRVPPVATKSSITMARSPGWTAPTCSSKQSVPYSRTYFSEITSPKYEACQSLA